MAMVELQGHLVVITPCNDMRGHWFYQLAPELLWRVFAPENGFAVRRLWLHEERSRRYEVRDPAVVGRRGDFKTTRPTTLFVVA
jgi:hypothetical protein